MQTNNNIVAGALHDMAVHYLGKNSRFFSKYAFNPLLIFSSMALLSFTFSSNPDTLAATITCVRNIVRINVSTSAEITVQTVNCRQQVYKVQLLHGEVSVIF